jgi:2-polyprenyl-3-methyl-5-hydroxy-6-metoxy-1,4-benzoquinol methylase
MSDKTAATNARSPVSFQTIESFQPIAVQSPANKPWLFKLRCLADLQLGSIVKFLRPALARLNGSVLDVGAGQSPWRAWLPSSTRYQGIDVAYAEEFGMESQRADIVYYNGIVMPFDDASFDNVLCIEVLEHSADPQLLIAEIARVICPQGTLLLTVPWSARQHHLPHDYHRFTRARLLALLTQQGFGIIDIKERGNDIGAIANKLTVLTIRLLMPPKHWRILYAYPLYVPLGVLSGVLAVIFIVVAHISVALGMGSTEDPLGYFVQATRTP